MAVPPTALISSTNARAAVRLSAVAGITLGRKFVHGPAGGW